MLLNNSDGDGYYPGFPDSSSLVVETIKKNLMVGDLEQERLKEKSIFGIIRENMMGDGLRREN